jgi:ATP-dependent Clp protease ATP-binding subunit ClpA
MRGRARRSAKHPGQPVELALHRASTIAVKRGERRIQAGHLLNGLLAAEHGRVPRALQIAGIDAHELRAQI